MAISGAHMQFWLYGFIPVVFTHSFWWPLAVGMLIAQIVIWPADHRNDPLEPALFWHIGLPTMLALGAALGKVFLTALRFPRILEISVSHGGEVDTLGIFNVLLVFLVSLLVTGVFLFMGKFDPAVSSATANSLGGLLIALGIAGILICFLYFWFSRGPRKDWARMNGKYYLVLFLLLAVFGVYDMVHNGVIPRPHQGWITLIVVVVVYVLGGLWSYYVKSSPRDPFYRNWSRLWRGFVALLAVEFVLVVFGWVADDFVSDRDFWTVLIAVVIYSVLLYVSLVFVSYFRIEDDGDARAVERRSSLSRTPNRTPNRTLPPKGRIE